MPPRPPLPLLCALGAASLALVTACGGPAADAGYLRVGLQDEFKTLDPAVGYDVPSWAAEHLVYNGLVTYGFDARVKPDLAEAWKVEDGGRRYVFTLREGLRFHDGKPVTAPDVVYSLDRLLDPATRSPGAAFYTGVAGAQARLAGKAETTSGIKAVDPRTVEIALTAPDPIFLQLLAMPFASVVPAGSTGAALARKPVGTGPFALKEWAAGARISFSKNADYHDPDGPRAAGVTIALGLNESLETLKFERGELDFLGVNRGIPSADFARLKKDARFADRMHEGPDAAVHYVSMNTEVAPFTDVRVRQAVAHAIDKQRIVMLVAGRGTVAQGILPPSMPGFDPALRGYPHDPLRAQALLAQAGYPQGFATTYYIVSNDTARKVAQSIQQDLAKVGIRLTLKPLAFPTFLEAKATRGRVPIASGNWTQDYPDPSNFLTTLFHSRNIKAAGSLNDTYYKSPQVDAALDAGGRESAAPAREAAFRRAEAAIVQDAPIVPLYHPVKYQLVSERVTGYRLHPVWAMDLSGVRVAD